MPNPAPWLIDYPDTPDEFDTAAAGDILGDVLGRFACGLCADNRDAAEAAAAELRRAHALLRLILRAEVKPIKSEGLEDDRTAQALLGHVAAWAILKARVELYFQDSATAFNLVPAQKK
jgi:hypothetical protein